MARLQPNISAFASFSGGWQTQEWANDFVVQADVPLVGLMWFRRTTTANRVPSILRLWRADTQAIVWQAPSIPDNGQVGWQTITGVDLPILLSGVHYRVSYVWPAAVQDGCAYTDNPNPGPVPEYPLAYGAVKQYENGGANLGTGGAATTGFPGVAGGPSLVMGLDVLVDATGLQGAGVTQADIDAIMRAWFSGTLNDHPNDLPAVTSADAKQLIALLTTTDTSNLALGIGGQVNAAIATISSVLTIVSYLQDNGLPDINGWVNAARDVLSAKSDALAALLNTSSDALTSGFGQVGHIAATQGGGGGFSGDPASGWYLVDETDWQGALAWQVPADMYVLSLTDLAGRTPVDVAGVQWYPRLGWWAPLNGFQVGSRRYFDFLINQLVVEGGNMPGVLLKTGNPITGHIQAWRHS
jgi:hypothetical protein